MRSALFHWHRLREWLLDLSAARHFRAVHRHRDAGNRSLDRAREHGRQADLLDRPPEWLARRVERAHDPDTIEPPR